LAERGIVVDHVRVYRWVQKFTAEFIDAARPTRHATGDRWLVDDNVIEADHGRLKARPRPMGGLKGLASARSVARGHAVVQNLRRGHYELTTGIAAHDRVRIAFTELAYCL